MDALGRAIRRHLSELKRLSGPELADDRYRRFRDLGVYLEGELSVEAGDARG